VPVERRLRLRPDPPRHAVPADEDDKCSAAVHRRLESVEPPVARLQLGLVEEDGEPLPRQVVAQPPCYREVVAAVAEKDRPPGHVSTYSHLLNGTPERGLPFLTMALFSFRCRR
jgi:hypothetical protein